MMYYPGWTTVLMHQDCPECEECTENAIKHAELTEGTKATSSFQQVQDNGPNILVHAATVIKRGK